MGYVQEKWFPESLLVLQLGDNLVQSLSHSESMQSWEPHTVLDAIEVGIAVFDSRVVKRVDAIQRHCFVYEKRFDKDSNDVNGMDSDLEKESQEGRCWEALIINTIINTPKTRDNPTPLSAEVGSVINGTRQSFDEDEIDGACGWEL